MKNLSNQPTIWKTFPDSAALSNKMQSSMTVQLLLQFCCCVPRTPGGAKSMKVTEANAYPFDTDYEGTILFYVQDYQLRESPDRFWRSHPIRKSKQDFFKIPFLICF